MDNFQPIGVVGTVSVVNDSSLVNVAVSLSHHHCAIPSLSFLSSEWHRDFLVGGEETSHCTHSQGQAADQELLGSNVRACHHSAGKVSVRERESVQEQDLWGTGRVHVKLTNEHVHSSKYEKEKQDLETVTSHA